MVVKVKHQQSFTRIWDYTFKLEKQKQISISEGQKKVKKKTSHEKTEEKHRNSEEVVDNVF